jgi:hypothetical protein
MIIPTKYRHKVPRDLSYPVGAELLTSVFEHVPQCESLTVTFWADVSNVRERLTADRPLPTIRAEYSKDYPGINAPRAWIAGGWYDPRWTLTIYAIPRRARAAVRDLLITAGLGAIRDWLVAARTPVWLSGRHSRTILIQVDDGTLTIEDD